MHNAQTSLSAEQIARPTHYGYRRTVVANWQELLPGDVVVLVGSGQDRFSGIVDAVSDDGSLLWILQDGGAGRRLFHQPDGYKTLINPRNT